MIKIIYKIHFTGTFEIEADTEAGAKRLAQYLILGELENIKTDVETP